MMTQFVKVNGNQFLVRTWGAPENPTVLMLHGFPEYSGAWEELADLLKDRFYCVAPDQRGYGQSYAPENVKDYKIGYLVEDLKGIIDHFLGPVMVLGHDWGAAAAYALAIAHPDLVSKLVIMNGVHPIPFQRALLEDEAQNAASQYIPWLRREGSETILAKNDFARLIAMFSQSMDMGWMRGARLDRYKSAWKDVQGVRTMVHWYRATGLIVPKPENIPQSVPDMHAAGMRISMPHLLLWGENDTALLPKSYGGLRDLCDDLTIITIPYADHWLHHQVPEKVAAHILHWISAPRKQ